MDYHFNTQVLKKMTGFDNSLPKNKNTIVAPMQIFKETNSFSTLTPSRFFFFFLFLQAFSSHSSSFLFLFCLLMNIQKRLQERGKRMQTKRIHTQRDDVFLLERSFEVRESGRKKRLLRPYQEESTTSRLISEVKPLRAWLVLGLETTWEHQVS